MKFSKKLAGAAAIGAIAALTFGGSAASAAEGDPITLTPQITLGAESFTVTGADCINPGGTRTGMRASAFPSEDPLKLKTPADIMPLYLWLMGDDSRRKTGMTFDAQPGRKPGISQ